MAGDYFVTTDYDAEDAPMIYTYTLDGEMIAKMEASLDLVQGASPFGECVPVYLEDRIKVYDRQQLTFTAVIK